MRRNTKRKPRRSRSNSGSKIFVFILIVVLIVVFIFLIKDNKSISIDNIIPNNVFEVRLNEVMSSNKGIVVDPNGNSPDWIELYNPSNKAEDISGYGLSDDMSDVSKYKFPEGTKIEANSYLTIWCSGNNTEVLNAPFKLSDGEIVVFHDPSGNLVDSIEIHKVTSGFSLGLNENNTWVEYLHPSVGLQNSGEYLEPTFKTNMSGLYISEMMGMNDTALDTDGDDYDWIELHNGSTDPINLQGYSLYDKTTKWTFPNVTIKPDEYLTVYASGLDKSDTETSSALHTNFKISSKGETILLLSPEDKIVDLLQADSFKVDVSFGRGPNAEMLYYETPTPNALNANGSQGITSTPKFVTTPGIYDVEIQLELSVPEGETIHYTTDCTIPTESSPVYDGPITLSHNTVVRTVSVRDGYITGYTNTGTYLFAGDNVNHDLPVVTLVTDPDNLWDSKTGIYATGDKFDPSLPYSEALTTATYYQAKLTDDEDAWERDGSLELFDENGSQVFSQNISMRLAGSFGRGRAQKGFNITARTKHGDNRMSYEFFADREFDKYKSLVLRAGGQDQSRSKIRDELATGLLEGTDVNVIYQAYKPHVLYLNGEYWGVYFMKEKRNRFFIAQHENTSNNDDMDIGYASTRSNYGSNDEWMELMKYIKKHDLSNSESYDYVKSQMDVNSFMDYMICEIYVGNSDYANIQYYKLPEGKWKWIYYDFCWGFNNVNHKTLHLRRGSRPAGSDLFNALLKNSEWKDAFIRRFAELLNTVYTPERVNAHIDELYNSIQPEMAREREKFNQSTFMGEKQFDENIATYDKFISEIDYLRKFANERPDKIKAQIKKEFKLSDDYMAELFVTESSDTAS